MIRFTKVGWWVVFYWWGGINRKTLRASVGYLGALVILYLWSYLTGMYVETAKENIRLLASFVVFLLVFRLNQCFQRQHTGQTAAVSFFCHCEQITSACSHSIKGAGDNYFGEASEKTLDDATLQRYAELAIVTKINCVRLVLAFVISTVLHWRLLVAETFSNSELDDTALELVTFLYCRLHELLYVEEMEVIDKALWVSREPSSSLGIVQKLLAPVAGTWQNCGKSASESDGQVGDFRFLSDSNRFRKREAGTQSLLLGTFNEESEDVVATPVPKIIMLMLLDVMEQPLSQPWGYQERLLNTVLRQSQGAMHDFANLNNLIVMPLPLAYLQHCRVLLMILALSIPLVVDPQAGMIDNILMPFLIFWALMGFEVLAEMMENPMGDHESDLNLLQLIHGVEVHAKHAFDTTTLHRSSTRLALRRPLKDFGMDAGASALVVSQERTRPSPAFDTYFWWRPIPTLMLQSRLNVHGHVDILHEMRAASGSTPSSYAYYDVRPLLRRAFRPQDRDGGLYRPVNQNGDRNDVFDGALDSLRKDSGVVHHYLVFGGICKKGHNGTAEEVASPESKRHAAWRTRAQALLSKRSASSLLGVCEELDTERSMIGLAGYHGRRNFEMVAPEPASTSTSDGTAAF